MAIKNIQDLQKILLKNIEALDNGETELEKVGILAKSCEVMMSSIKLQLQYATLNGQSPEIEFLDNAPNVIENHTTLIE